MQPRTKKYSFITFLFISRRDTKSDVSGKLGTFFSCHKRITFVVQVRVPDTLLPYPVRMVQHLMISSRVVSQVYTGLDGLLATPEKVALCIVVLGLNGSLVVADRAERSNGPPVSTLSPAVKLSYGSRPQEFVTGSLFITASSTGWLPVSKLASA